MLEADQRRLLGEFVRAHRERMRPTTATGRRRTLGPPARGTRGPRRHQRDLVHMDRTGPAGAGLARGARPHRPSARFVARRARLFVQACGPRRSASIPGAFGRRAPLPDRRGPGDPMPGLWPRPPLERVLLERSGGAALSRLARRRSSAQPAAVCVSRACRPRADSGLERPGATAACRISRRFRPHVSRRPGQGFLETLRGESPFFAEAWDEQAVQIREGGLRLFNHPDDGRLSFTQHTFAPAERPDYKLVILTPADR